MNEIIAFFQHITSPEWLIENGGMYIILAIIFAETGLFLGFLLPGDFLLFLTGAIIAETSMPFDSPFANLVFWESMMILAAVFGNIFGYWFGKKSGNFLVERKDTWYFKKKHIIQAKEFYEKKGGGAILLARFLPVIRTFAPIVAGMVGMSYKKFLYYNILGAFIWVVSIVTAGYFLGKNPWVKANLEYIILGMVLVTTLPVFYKMFFAPKKKISSASIVD